MKLKRTRNFNKQYKKLPIKIQEQFAQRFNLWLHEPEHSSLRVHKLKGSLRGYWSFNVNSDVRAVYFYEEEDTVVLSLVGTHSQLY